MQKASPLILVLILALTATIFSVHTPRVHTPKVPSAPPAVTTLVKPEPVVAKVTPRAWPQASSDIAPDSGATFGSLANGFRYIIYPNAEPPKRVSIRLHIAAGSLVEADDQRGLAHFLEHMVFNGSKNYSVDELIPKMQRLGISFGAHINAFTSFDETVYMLDLPDLSEDTMKLAFTVMRDFGDGALISREEIDKERGVILSEKVSRDSVGTRLMEQQFAKILPDSRVSKRFPIGTEEVIKSAPRERFVDLYQRYYTPARMTFVVVGDVAPQEIEARIQKVFGSMVNPVTSGTDPDLGPVKQPEGIEASVFSDKEVASTDVSLTLVRPHVVKADTIATRAELMTLEVAHAMLSRRFDRLSKMEGSAIESGSASNQTLFNYVDFGSIDLTVADDRWQDAVPILEQEFRRALDYGFSAAELDEAKSKLLNSYEQQVKQKASRKSETIATALAKQVNDNEVFSDPATDLEIVKQVFASMDLAACHQAFKKFWDAPGYHLMLTAKEKQEGAEKELAARFEESRSKPVEKPILRAIPVFGYSDFGKPGTLLSRKELKDLGITQLVLSNQVRVNLKTTDFEKGKIRLLARVGSGKLSQPKGMPMLDHFATAVFEGGGLGKHTIDDLQQILAGKNVGSSFTISDDAFNLNGTTTPADFATELQLMCATLTDPGYRKEALWQFQKSIPVILQELKHTTAGPQQEMEEWLHGGDSRFAIASAEKLASYTLEDAKKWLTPELTKGYLELTLVGDFEVDKILPDLLATFGALPARAATLALAPDARKIAFPAAPAAKTFTYDSHISQGIAAAVWKTDGIRGHQKEFRRLNLLGLILGDRLREEIREKLGASYSPNAAASGSDALEGFGYLVGESIGKPEDIDRLLQSMRELADRLATQGATADELDRALKPTLSQLEKSLRDNRYWLGTVMSQCQLDPKRLELARGRDADYRSITLEEINALAKKYLIEANALLISIKPAG